MAVEILSGILMIAVGIAFFHAGVYRRVPDHWAIRFLRLDDLTAPPKGFLLGTMFIGVGLFVIVQSIRAIFGLI